MIYACPYLLFRVKQKCAALFRSLETPQSFFCYWITTRTTSAGVFALFPAVLVCRFYSMFKLLSFLLPCAGPKRTFKLHSFYF